MSSPRLLHIGCFDQPIPGWLNTDVTPHIWIARVPGLARALNVAGVLPAERYAQHRQGVFRSVTYMNATRRFPYPDGSFDAVFSSHVLEHLHREDGRRCLAEAHRVLRPGGICRIAVPDLDRVVAEYKPDEADRWLLGVFEATRKGDKNRHHWHYNERTLGALLREIGFKEVQRCAYREGRCPDVARIDNRPESLFVEAVK